MDIVSKPGSISQNDHQLPVLHIIKSFSSISALYQLISSSFFGPRIPERLPGEARSIPENSQRGGCGRDVPGSKGRFFGFEFFGINHGDQGL